VSALHRWERRRVASSPSSSCSGCGGGYRVPVIDVPLSVLTSAFLSVAAVYLLLL
jgi:hypothetical protein